MVQISHRFHIPVMGLGYTLDTPIKVAKYGISSVISIVQDEVIEKARLFYSRVNQIPFSPISKKQKNYRSKRITAYLNLVNKLVNRDFEALKNSESEIEKYARLLPDNISSDILKGNTHLLRKGAIDVNIMTKLDRQPSGEESIQTEACSALKGYAESDLSSSLVLSAGLNPRLFSYMQEFSDFFPDPTGLIKKKIIVKVSDFRSALLQGKMLAKKGLWVSEYRVESGLNCGGHTFATEGLLLGPILEEFKQSRTEMYQELLGICHKEWQNRSVTCIDPEQKISVQGGLGNSNERLLMEEYYQVDATGWGSPFLLVPEATSLDDETLNELIDAGESDIYNSNISPLGIRFNTIKNNSAERIKRRRIESGKPGSPCVRRHLAFDKTYDQEGLCTASIVFQKKKITELSQKELSNEAYQFAYDKIVEKECICDGLAVSFLKKFSLTDKENNEGVSICPGPNLAYFDRTYSLEEMVRHIYGKVDVINMDRPNVFIKELGLYIDYFEELKNAFKVNEYSIKEERRILKFRENLLSGIEYYSELQPCIKFDNDGESKKFIKSLEALKGKLGISKELEVVS